MQKTDMHIAEWRDMVSAPALAQGCALAAWMTLTALLPLWMNPIGESVYQAPKDTLLRLLALFTVLSLCACAALGCIPARDFGPWWRATFRHPLVWCGLAVPVISAISCVFSMDPTQSVWGDPMRGGGLISYAALSALFLVMTMAGREVAFFRRLCEAVTLGLAPVIVFALAPSAGVGNAGATVARGDGRVDSLLGNPVFLGHYLAMTMPLVAWLAVSSWRAGRRVQSGVATVVLASAGVALWLTGSRGPLLGAAAALGIGALCLMHYQGFGRRLQIGLRLSLLLLLVAAGVAFLHHAAAPADCNRRGSGLRREGSIRVRLLMQQSLTKAMTERAPLDSGDGMYRDSHAALRPWLGYGPQCVRMAMDRWYPPNFERFERPGAVLDSAHNEPMDFWGESGALGLAVYCALIVSALAAATRRRKRDGAPWRAAIPAVAGGVGALIFYKVLDGAWGMGFGWGIAIGVVALADGASRADAPCETSQGYGGKAMENARVCVLCALTAHLVATQFAPRIVAGAALFWGLCGLLVAWERVRTRSAGANDPPHANMAASERAVGRGWAWLALAVSIGLSGAMVRIADAATPSSATAYWFKTLIGPTGWSVLAVFAIAFVWIRSENRSGQRRALFGLGAAAVVWATVLALHTHWAAAYVVGLEPITDLRVLTFLVRMRYAWAVIALSVLLGWALTSSSAENNPTTRSRPTGRRPIGAVRFIAALALAITMGLPVAHLILDRTTDANVGVGVGHRFARAEARDAAIRGFESLRLSGPWADVIAAGLHDTHGQRALVAQDTRRREADMRAAVHWAGVAAARLPADARHHARDGAARRMWADMADSRALTAERTARAIIAFDRAVALNPTRPDFRLRRARAHMSVNTASTDATRDLQELLELDPSNTQALELLAVAYDASARIASGRDAKSVARRLAADFARAALERPPLEGRVPKDILERIRVGSEAD